MWDKLRGVLAPPLFRALNRLPWPAGEEVLGLLAVAHGCLDPRRWRRVLRWAGHQEAGRWRACGLAVSLLYNHGRHLAMTTRLGVRDPATFRRRTLFHGLEHLEGASRQHQRILLLGFHLGLGDASLPLRTLGYRFTFGGETRRFAWPELSGAWAPLRRDESAAIHWRDASTAASGLYRLHRALLAGERVALTADGRWGREAFRVPLPGQVMIVRAGWFALRRHTGAITLPALTHRDGQTRVVTIHPPLPPPDPDPSRDLASCREALSRILETYVRGFPEQCASLALSPLKRPSPPAFE